MIRYRLTVTLRDRAPWLSRSVKNRTQRRVRRYVLIVRTNLETKE